MGVDKEDLVSGNSNNASTDEDDVKDEEEDGDDDDDDDDVQILDDSGEEKTHPDDDVEEMGVYPAGAENSTTLTEHTSVQKTEQNPNGQNGKCTNGKKTWNIATNFYSKISTPTKPVRFREVNKSENGQRLMMQMQMGMVDESPSKNAKSLCAKIHQIDLTPAEEEEEDEPSQSDDDDGGGGDIPRMEVEDVGGDMGGAGVVNADDNSMFCNSCEYSS